MVGGVGKGVEYVEEVVFVCWVWWNDLVGGLEVWFESVDLFGIVIYWVFVLFWIVKVY